MPLCSSELFKDAIFLKCLGSNWSIWLPFLLLTLELPAYSSLRRLVKSPQDYCESIYFSWYCYEIFTYVPSVVNCTPVFEPFCDPDWLFCRCWSIARSPKAVCLNVSFVCINIAMRYFFWIVFTIHIFLNLISNLLSLSHPHLSPRAAQSWIAYLMQCDALLFSLSLSSYSIYTCCNGWQVRVWCHPFLVLLYVCPNFSTNGLAG